jgi:hypothetical protein
MLVVLRFVGVFNAAVWLGSGLFFTFGIAPAVFSDEMKGLFAPYGDYSAGLIAQQLIARYFVVHAVCGVVALIHFFAEMFYAGRPFQKGLFGLLIVALSLGVLGGAVLQPKLKALHAIKYSRSASDQERETAGRHFTWLHATSQIGNVLTLILLVGYLWRATNPPNTTRFVSAHKFRG